MSRRRSPQGELHFPPGHGGKRAGAGRPKATPGERLPHVARPAHVGRHPVHVTLRVNRRGGNLRRWKVASAVGKAFRAATAGALVERFRVVHFSIQTSHLHLIVEADDRDALARGMKGIGCRVAKAINRAHRRRGRVLGDRYHARALATPLEVKRALRYVLGNADKHADDDLVPDLGTQVVDGLDPLSSARWFDGWSRPPPPQAQPPPTSPARTWLLTRGWRQHGTIARVVAAS